jgi:hypothetical protein
LAAFGGTSGGCAAPGAIDWVVTLRSAVASRTTNDCTSWGSWSRSQPAGQVLQRRRRCIKPFKALFQRVLLLKRLVQVPLQSLCQLRIALQPAGLSAQHLPGLPLHRVRVAQPVDQVFTRVAHRSTPEGGASKLAPPP